MTLRQRRNLCVRLLPALTRQRIEYKGANTLDRDAHSAQSRGTMNIHAAHLIARSYMVAAKRVGDALAGYLTISNKRAVDPPWAATAEIVGLCGQGGRHPYFRMPESALRTAVHQILSLAMSSDPLEGIMLASQGLRAATVFDDTTGCVNDHQSALVPLLPPEEIWFQGREMPLDIWRLLFAETDTVAAAVAADIDLSDVAVGGVSYSSLTFADLMKRIGSQNVEFDLTEESIPQPFAGTLQGQCCRVPLRRVFFEAGCLLTPLKASGTARWSVAARYVDWIHQSPTSVLCVDCALRQDSIDARFKGLFAEEMAVGMMAIVLQDYFGCHLINNTVEVLGKRPEGVLADFIADGTVSGKHHAVIVESKGAIKNIVAQARRSKAKKQVGNTFHPNPAGPEIRLTCCSTIRYSDQKARSVCDVCDPPGEGKQDDSREAEPAPPEDWWRSAFARTLRFVGLDAAASQVLRGQPATLLIPSEQAEQSDRAIGRFRQLRQSIARALDAEVVMGFPGGCVVIDRAVLAMLRKGISPDPQDSVRSVVADRAQRRSQSERRERSGAGGRRIETFVSGLGIGLASYGDFE